ncbi:MAG: hypothetical protein ABSH35_03740 [Isosphaeraceae bacterium]|jgi:hypothetical protein
MTRWKLTVFVAQGSTPVVTRLIDLAERRPLMSGNEMTEAIFAYDTEMDAQEASRRIEGAELGAICSIASFHAGPSLGNPGDAFESLDEMEEFEDERRGEVIRAIALRNAAGRMEEMP